MKCHPSILSLQYLEARCILNYLRRGLPVLPCYHFWFCYHNSKIISQKPYFRKKFKIIGNLNKWLKWFRHFVYMSDLSILDIVEPHLRILYLLWFWLLLLHSLWYNQGRAGTSLGICHHQLMTYALHSIGDAKHPVKREPWIRQWKYGP